MAVESPDPRLDRALGWAKVMVDAALHEVPGLGRVVKGAAPSAPRTPPELAALSGAELILAVVEGLWGIESDGSRGEVRVEPSLPAEWPEMALRHLRVGETLLDLRVRRRPGRHRSGLHG